MEYRYYIFECIACVLVTGLTCYMLVSNIRLTFCLWAFVIIQVDMADSYTGIYMLFCSFINYISNQMFSKTSQY